jgi:galactoside O-acetyltransferase
MAYTDLEYKFKKLGRNVTIGRNVYFRYPDLVELGDNVVIDDHCYFTTALVMGEFSHIGPQCSVIGGRDAKFHMHPFSGLSAGSHVVCGTDDYTQDGLLDTVPAEFRVPVKVSTIEIRKHAIVGTACVLHPGVIVGEGAVAGSMTLVTRDLEPWWIYFGIPARKFKQRQKKKTLAMENEFKNLIKKK